MPEVSDREWLAASSRRRDDDTSQDDDDDFIPLVFPEEPSSRFPLLRGSAVLTWIVLAAIALLVVAAIVAGMVLRDDAGSGQSSVTSTVSLPAVGATPGSPEAAAATVTTEPGTSGNPMSTPAPRADAIATPMAMPDNAAGTTPAPGEGRPVTAGIAFASPGVLTEAGPLDQSIPSPMPATLAPVASPTTSPQGTPTGASTPARAAVRPATPEVAATAVPTEQSFVPRGTASARELAGSASAAAADRVRQVADEDPDGSLPPGDGTGGASPITLLESPVMTPSLDG